jgi:hypothetical protein
MRDRPPHVLLSNPEMLHLSFLPYHGQWHEFLRRLEFVVVDEVHSYRGVMGSNMAWVFRRLLRVCEYYGSRPTFVFCSATVGNPGELASGLTGLDGRVRDRLHLACRGQALLLRQPPRGRGPDDGQPAPLGPAQGHPDHRLHPVAQDDRADRHVVRGAPRVRSSTRSAPTGPASSRASGARSSASWPAASCLRSSPPARWSWASTSEASTSACWWATPDRSWPPCSGAAASGAAGAARRSCSSATRTPWTSTS